MPAKPKHRCNCYTNTRRRIKGEDLRKAIRVANGLPADTVPADTVPADPIPVESAQIELAIAVDPTVTPEKPKTTRRKKAQPEDDQLSIEFPVGDNDTDLSDADTNLS